MPTTQRHPTWPLGCVYYFDVYVDLEELCSCDCVQGDGFFSDRLITTPTVAYLSLKPITQRKAAFGQGGWVTQSKALLWPEMSGALVSICLVTDGSKTKIIQINAVREVTFIRCYFLSVFDLSKCSHWCRAHLCDHQRLVEVLYQQLTGFRPTPISNRTLIIMWV